MIDIGGLAAPMAGDGCRAELFADEHHEALMAACGAVVRE